MRFEQNWTQKILTSHGFGAVLRVDIIRENPWSTVWQCKTAQGSFFLKKMHPAFSYEPKLICVLHSLKCASLPTVIALCEKRLCFLTTDAGTPLRTAYPTLNFEIIEAVFKDLLSIQKRTAPYLETLLALGVPDRRLNRLPPLFAQHFEAVWRAAHVDQTSTPFPNATLKSLYLRRFQEKCASLAAFGFEETLEHGDFHDGNVLIKEGRITLADWGDAALAHPLFSVVSFFESAFRHQRGVSQDVLKAICALYGPQALHAFDLAQQIRPFVWWLSFARVPFLLDHANAVGAVLKNFLVGLTENTNAVAAHPKEL